MAKSHSRATFIFHDNCGLAHVCVAGLLIKVDRCDRRHVELRGISAKKRMLKKEGRKQYIDVYTYIDTACVEHETHKKRIDEDMKTGE